MFLLPLLHRGSQACPPCTSSAASSESGFSSLSYSDCRLYFSKEKMLCEEETPKSQRVEESKESSSSSSDEGEDEASESEAEKEAGGPEAGRPQSAGGRHVSEGRWSQPWGTDSQTGPRPFASPFSSCEAPSVAGWGWKKEHNPGYLADS